MVTITRGEDTVKDLVEKIRKKTINFPEFEREFKWKPEKVLDFADSLYRGYPAGALYFWRTIEVGEEKKWIVDGLQRLTSLCILFGQRPPWIKESIWRKKIEKDYNILVDIDKIRYGEKPELVLPKKERLKSEAYIPLREILSWRENEIKNKARELAKKLSLDDIALYEELKSIYEIQKRIIYYFEIDGSYSDAAEIFRRINEKPTTVRFREVVLARLSTRYRNWKSKEFKPFIEEISNEFKFDSERRKDELEEIILRIFAGVLGDGEIEALLNVSTEDFNESWTTVKRVTKDVFETLVDNYRLYPGRIPGTLKPLPILPILKYKFGEAYHPDLAFEWFLTAVAAGRWHTASLVDDIRTVLKKNSFNDAIENLKRRIKFDYPKANDISISHMNSSLSIYLIALILRAEAKDWIDKRVLKHYEAVRHHFFPRKVLKSYKEIEPDFIDSLANCTLTTTKTNNKIGDMEPYQYIQEFSISESELKRQFIPLDDTLWKAKNYKKFIEERSKLLEIAVNVYIRMLKEGRGTVIPVDEIYEKYEEKRQ